MKPLGTDIVINFTTDRGLEIVGCDMPEGAIDIDLLPAITIEFTMPVAQGNKETGTLIEKNIQFKKTGTDEFLDSSYELIGDGKKVKVTSKEYFLKNTQYQLIVKENLISGFVSNHTKFGREEVVVTFTTADIEDELGTTPRNPILIYSARQLYDIYDLYVDEKGVSKWGQKHYKLMSDIDLKDLWKDEELKNSGVIEQDINTWIPNRLALDRRVPYSGGSFNGNGKTVKNLIYKKNTSRKSGINNMGLFGEIRNKFSISNLTITDVEIGVKNENADFANSVGVLVGGGREGVVIDNCHVIGRSEKPIKIVGNKSVGVLVGRADGTIIKNCSVSFAEIEYLSNTNTGSFGGIVGSDGGETTINNCRVENLAINGPFKTGGIVGEGGKNSSINNCIVTNVALSGVLNTETDNYSIGGIAGYYQGTINNVNVENVEIRGVTKLGGAVGELFGNILNSSVKNVKFGLEYPKEKDSYGNYVYVPATNPSLIGGFIGNSNGIINNGIIIGKKFVISDKVGIFTGSDTGTYKDCYYLEGALPDGITGVDQTGKAQQVVLGLSGNPKEIKIGQTISLEVTKNPADVSYTPMQTEWSVNELGQIISRDNTKATVTALQAGLLEITANIDGIEKNLKILVVEAPKFKINIGTMTGGMVECEKDQAEEGTIVAISIKPNAGMQLKANSLKVTTETGTEVNVINNKFVMPAEAITITAEFQIIPSAGGGGGGGGGGIPSNKTTPPSTSTSGGTTTATTIVETVTDSADNTTASVTEKQVKEVVESAVTEAKAKMTDAVVKIKIAAPKTVTAIVTTIPREAVSNIVDNKVTAFSVNTPFTDITFNLLSAKSIQSQLTGDMKIAVAKVATNALDNEVMALFGDRPVVNISIASQSKNLTNFGTGKLTISIPYTLKVSEKAENIVVYYINEAGKTEKMTDVKYDAKSKKVIFTTNHLSMYAIGYEEPGENEPRDHKIVDKFTDVKSDAWYADAVYYLADRGVIKGRTKTTFVPHDNITRSEFVMILANLSGEDLSCVPQTTGFNDIASGAWYKNAISWAESTGVATGFIDQNGELVFAPDQKITRQDLAVLIDQYARKISKHEIKAYKEPQVFKDDARIAPYAREAVSRLQRAGIISGRDTGVFAPTDNATRAEAAQLIATFTHM